MKDGFLKVGVASVDVEVANPIHNKEKVMEVSKVFYNLAGARLYGILEEEQNCLMYFEKYIEGLIKFKHNRSIMETETEGIVANVFHNSY